VCYLSELCHSYSSFLSRFVDRDMFMRFMGAGIGHKATNEYTAALRNDVLAMAKATLTQPDTNFVNPQIPDSEDALLAEEQDYGYELGSESEGDEGMKKTMGQIWELKTAKNLGRQKICMPWVTTSYDESADIEESSGGEDCCHIL
jgi:hypothetical protein